MTIYIFPIFLFGLLITGIVYLGISQAAEWAKKDALLKRQSEDGAFRPGAVAASPASSSNGSYRR